MPKLVLGNDQVNVKRNLRPLVYSIEWTDPPCLQPRTKVGELGVIQRFSNTDICLLGAHKGSTIDAQLQLDIVTRLFNSLIGKKRKLSIGLSILPSTNQNEKALKEFLENKDNVRISYSMKSYCYKLLLLFNSLLRLQMKRTF
jgi:hypothetical protein